MTYISYETGESIGVGSTLTLSYNGNGPFPCRVIEPLTWTPSTGGNLIVMMPAELSGFGAPYPVTAYISGGVIFAFFVTYVGEGMGIYGYGPTGQPIPFFMNGMIFPTSTGTPGRYVGDEVTAQEGMIVPDTDGSVWICTRSWENATTPALWHHLTASGGGGSGLPVVTLTYNGNGPTPCQVLSTPTQPSDTGTMLVMMPGSLSGLGQDHPVFAVVTGGRIYSFVLVDGYNGVLYAFNATGEGTTMRVVGQTFAQSSGTPGNTVSGGINAAQGMIVPDDDGSLWVCSAGHIATVQTATWVHLVAGGGGSDLSLTINSGERIESGLQALQITKQPPVQPTGIPQPLPPLNGFDFPGESIHHFTTDFDHICTARDGAVWGTGGSGKKVYRYAPTQTGAPTTIYTDTSAEFTDIISGPDGAVYVVDRANKKLVKFVLQNTLTTITPTTLPITTLTGTEVPLCMCVGPDKLIWLVTLNPTRGTSRLFRLTKTGTVVTVTTIGAATYVIANGPDGNVYTMTQGSYRLRKITYPSLVVSTVHTFPVGNQGGLAPAPDGSLWGGWNNTTGGGIAFKIDATGTYATIALGGILTAVVIGGGGDIWFTAATLSLGNLIKITVEGNVQGFHIGGGTNLFGITVGWDGSFWCAGTGLTSAHFSLLVGGIRATSLPTTDPHRRGEFWNTAGTVKVSAG